VRRRDLDEEEKALWRQATRDVSPVRRRAAAKTVARAPKTAALKIKAKTAPAPAIVAAAALKTRSKQHAILGGGDPARDRAAATRRIEIDATIDLHGLTQAEAHRRLPHFLARAAARGARLVLVITGKGKADGLRGVLKSRFLDWIEEEPMRDLIARAAPAKPRDGGAGAFYVFLKRKGAGEAPAPSTTRKKRR
jgi:DNA-nicking Smr family endonuclease